MGDTLYADQELAPGAQLDSNNGVFRFVMQQDGNLVLYAAGNPLWDTPQTLGKAVSRCAMQGDGNLVIYGYPQALWATNTDGNPGARLNLQDDGNVVIYGPGNNVLWATHTGEAAKPYLPGQLDGLTFGPDLKAERVREDGAGAVEVPDGATIVVSMAFRGDHEMAMLVYAWPDPPYNSAIGEQRGNYGRSGEAWAWKNTSGGTVTLAVTGWYKSGPPDGDKPWRQHRVIASALAGSDGETKWDLSFQQTPYSQNHGMTCVVTVLA